MLFLSRLACFAAITVLCLALAFAFAGEPTTPYATIGAELHARLMLITYAFLLASALLIGAVLLALPDYYKRKRIMQRAHYLTMRYRR